MKLIQTSGLLAFLLTACTLSGFAVAGSSPIDVLHYTVSLDLRGNLKPPYKRSFPGDVQIRLRITGETSDISLDARNRSLLIKEVSGDAGSFIHEGNELRVPLNRMYDVGEEVTIRIKYEHKDVFDSAFYCNEGVVYTDCETAGARRWLPSNDIPSDKAGITLSALVPKGVQFCGNGELKDSLVLSNHVKYTYSSDVPASTYLFAFVASEKYMLAQQEWKYLTPGKGSMPVKFYYQRGETMFNLRNIISKTNRMLDYFSDIYCDYPFEKIAFATTDKYFPWGGMENQTIVTLCPDCWIEDLICHELVHHWFGNMISPAGWADIWLNEGFATYNEALWVEKEKGKEEYTAVMRYEAAKYFTSGERDPIYNPAWNIEEPNDTEVFEPATTYSKAGCVLYMLRYVLGDKTFFDVMKKYSNAPQFRFASVDTESFIKFIEENTGTELRWFFDQWIFSPGHPVYEPVMRKEKTPEGKWKVEYTINQTQRNGGFFRMPVDIRFTFADKSVITEQVVNTGNMQPFLFEYDKEPVSARLDPEDKIILKEIR